MKRIVIVMVALAALLVSSCDGFSSKEKDRFVRRHKAFVEKFVGQCDSYNADDWEEALAEYKESVSEYQKHLADMTAEERAMINNLNAEVNAKIVEYEFHKAGLQIEAAWDEAVETIKKLLD